VSAEGFFVSMVENIAAALGVIALGVIARWRQAS
jgi:hypothetical protein